MPQEEKAEGTRIVNVQLRELADKRYEGMVYGLTCDFVPGPGINAYHEFFRPGRSTTLTLETNLGNSQLAARLGIDYGVVNTTRDLGAHSGNRGIHTFSADESQAKRMEIQLTEDPYRYLDAEVIPSNPASRDEGTHFTL